jgi:hypothetical protein
LGEAGLRPVEQQPIAKELRERHKTSTHGPSWAESLTGPKRENEKGKEFIFFIFLEFIFGKRII